MYEVELEFPEERGVLLKNPFCRRGMDILWNYTFHVLAVYTFAQSGVLLCQIQTNKWYYVTDRSSEVLFAPFFNKISVLKGFKTKIFSATTRHIYHALSFEGHFVAKLIDFVWTS